MYLPLCAKLITLGPVCVSLCVCVCVCVYVCVSRLLMRCCLIRCDLIPDMMSHSVLRIDAFWFWCLFRLLSVHGFRD